MNVKRRKARPDEGNSLPALSIRQPQAAALLVPPGPFELPGWLTDYRGPLLIHATRRKAGDPPDDPAAAAAYGALLGVADLVDCVGVAGGGPDEAGYVWVLADPRPFARPIPYTGRMGLFQVAAAIVADALAALPPRPRRRTGRRGPS